MILKYKNYVDGVHLISEKKAAKDFSLPENYVGEIELECKMDKAPHQIILSCDLTAEAKFACDRCNSEFIEEINTEFQVTCFFEEGKTSEDEPNIKFISPDQDKIDLSEEIKEYLLLAIPMKILCSEDCKGLCVTCGINLNEKTCSCSEKVINPIWEPLQKLKNNSNN